MKTIKVALTIILFSISLTGYSQLNPVKNLYWNHWYSCPNNFFVLHWSPPDTSLTDTLVGYNIYRDSELYRFYTDTIAQHIIPQDTSFGGEDFLNFGGSFYIHVTAVYNKNHIESNYSDSIFSYGAMLALNEAGRKIISVEPNPVLDNSVVYVNFQDRKIESLTIINSSGQLIKMIYINSNTAKIRISDLNLKSDLYVLIVNGIGYKETYKFIKIK